MSKDYDIVGAFQRIEEELINSMLRNYKKHRAWEKDEGFNWEMWQAKQLKSLQEYRKNNKKKLSTYFNTINDVIEEMIIKSYEAGNMEQEAKILEAIKNGFTSSKKPSKMTDISGEFFKVNDRKLASLLKATKEDFEKAEIAMLRKANDEYRKTIFNAQVYANTGAGTMEQAIDMATKDFLSKGINCIEYKNGAKRAEWGVHTVIVTKRGGVCPKCVPHQGRVYIDDVWSWGTSKDGNYPLLRSAMEKGLLHPRCKDTCTTYFPGVSSKANPPSKAEQQKSIDIYILQQKQNYIDRMIRKYKNLETGSLDEDNRRKYKNKKLEWQREIKIYMGLLSRKEFNQGEFKELLIPMQKRYVKNIQ